MLQERRHHEDHSARRVCFVRVDCIEERHYVLRRHIAFDCMRRREDIPAIAAHGEQALRFITPSPSPHPRPVCREPRDAGLVRRVWTRCLEPDPHLSADVQPVRVPPCVVIARCGGLQERLVRCQVDECAQVGRRDSP